MAFDSAEVQAVMEAFYAVFGNSIYNDSTVTLIPHEWENIY